MIQKKLYIHWLCAFFFAAFIISHSQFKSTNDDSKYYTNLVVRYQDESLANILTPKWGVNFYSFPEDSYMRDQFPGQLLLGIAVAKIGVPAEQALHVLGMGFQILSIILLVKIASQYISIHQASILYYTLILTPMAFSYNIRGNHELGIMLFSFLSLYAGMKLSSSLKWSLVSAISCVMLLMIKGPFFIFGLGLTVIGYYFTEKKASFNNLIITLFLSSFLIAFVAYVYELLYLKYSGQSFLLEFYKIQIQQRALVSAHEHSKLVQKILNYYYYFSHYLIYALPWSLLVPVLFFKNKTNKEFIAKLNLFIRSNLSGCLFWSAAIFGLLFGVSDRTATRYVFPAYYLFSAWIILLLYSSSELLRKLHEKCTSIGIERIAPFLWLIAFGLHLL